MRHSPDDYEISTIEDLDPEPQPKREANHALEFVLGMLILIGVLCWGGWQWLQQQQIRDHYSSAVAAVANKKWDMARDEYLAAGNYKDAPARAAGVTKIVGERNGEYAVASLNVQKGQWAAALVAIRNVQKIDPKYLYTEYLSEEAERQVYAAALNGTIALRTEAKPPGLYYRARDKWNYLQNSDSASTVQWTGTGDHLIYDVPAPGASPVATPTDPTSSYLSGTQPGRRLVAVDLTDSALKPTPLTLDPSQYDWYKWGSHGVWAIKYGAHPQSNTAQNVLGIAPEAAFVYEAFSSTVTSTVDLPTSNWVVTDLSASGDETLLTEATASDDGVTRSSLYVAGGDGKNPRKVFSTVGQLYSAQFSPDNHYALVTADYLDTTTVGVRSVILLDLSSGNQRELAVNSIYGVTFNDRYYPAGATFLSNGPYAGDVALAVTSGENVDLSVLDPSSPETPLIKTELNANWFSVLHNSSWVGYEVDESLLLVANDSALRDISNSGLMRITKINLDGSSQTITQTLAPAQYVVAAMVRDNQLIYATYTTTYRAGDQPKQSIASVPITSIGDSEAKATTLYSGPALNPHPYLSDFHIGDTMLAYLVGGQLHASTYDGSQDVVLETGVEGFYPAFESTVVQWLR